MMKKSSGANQGFCRDHRPEIDFMRRPAVKICPNCRQVDQLSPSDFAWRTPRSKVLHNALKRFAPSALAASSALFAVGALVYQSVPTRTAAGTTPSTNSDTRNPANTSTDTAIAKTSAKPVPSAASSGISQSPTIVDTAVEKPMPALLPTSPMSRLPVADNIAKAIASRAVSGIQIEYDRGTAYLSGRVKTQSQRLAAETAAKKVPGVDTVASSIRVEWQD
jgi:hypothetical protein